MKNLMICIAALFLFSCTSKEIEIKLPAIISDGMVLQQNSDAALWGWCEKGTQVTIAASWDEKVTTKTDDDGKWMANIKTPAFGGPFTIEIKAGKTVQTISDVLIGEVWLGSGQSNMEMPLKGWPPNDLIEHSEEEIANADYADIRLFTVSRAISAVPANDVLGSWSACSPATAGNFSATAFFFAKKLYKELGVPIGIIHSSWGGTPAESWTSADFIGKVAGFETFTDDLEETLDSHDEYLEFLKKLEAIELSSLPQTDPYKNLDLNDQKYMDPTLDVSSWHSMKVPSLWETEGLAGFDGIVWFVKEFEYDGSLYPEGFELHLGAIDDMDATFVNGVEIGRTEEDGKYGVERKYDIPTDLLVEGKNRIAIKVTDNRGGGGIYTQSPALVKGGKTVVELGGEWKYWPVAIIKSNTIYVYGEGDKSFDSAPVMKVAFTAHTATSLYNGMIAPIVPYTLQGAIWYQGESNVGRAEQYETLFPTMIESWRAKWQSDFPFYFVQIAPYKYGGSQEGKSGNLRNAQFKTLQLENTGMVVTLDIGNPLNIHPGNKKDVGERLALWALAKDYQQGIVCSGPLYKTLKVEGSKMVVEFDYAEGLNLNSDESFFEIAGADGVFYEAKAKVDDDKIVAWCKKVSKPTQIRYAWSDTCEPNLFNGAGLPASTFISE